ncbi:unnamed protein product [Chrysodeixis includens]|uniref:Uncharacterized protein n=1 Tax=Chrysodeixis includens TaxID=689277 RepID=A0A9P0BY59_CHRIL|nr:unnamed protein product [Chrysodeixis includens]
MYIRDHQESQITHRSYAMMKLFSLIVGVAITGVVQATQSEETSNENGPITSQENEAGVRQIDVPEVVLQLKYDRGELNRIYLTQFRKDVKAWAPSVTARSNLCADLCHAGLGGEACGSTCSQLIPVGLQTALEETNQTSVVYGHPRSSVCPALCANQLGEPLCNCATPDEDHEVDWSAVCTAFCYDGYVLNGCPSCDATSSESPAVFKTRILTTYEGWAAWCDVQCRQGQGGAACNCSRTPFQ